MTATITDGRTQVIEDEVVKMDNPIPCHDLSNDGDCDNAAVWMTRPRCCYREIPLCEDCLFNFTTWADKVHTTKPNWKLACNYCGTVSILEPNYLIVLWRIK